jgi:hypothetical protein
MDDKVGDSTVGDGGYDIIGDVHGQADMLQRLLADLGYEESGGTWVHRSRHVVFVGDLIDRGPEQIKTVDIARRMVEAGSALIVAGNHEFNCVAFATPDPEKPGEYLRAHSEKNVGQHRAFLDEVGFGSSAHAEMVEWFMQLPLWLDLGELRVVHACWDEEGMEAIRGLVGPNNNLTPELVVSASQKNTPEWQAIEHLLKGPEVPVDSPYLDKGGDVRHHERVRWWDPEADTLRSGTYIPDGTTTVTKPPYPPLPTPKGHAAVAPYRSEVPLFYGHYWQRGTPTRSGEYTACVDYSAGKGGSLVAYRWSGESVLSDANFVAVDPSGPR